MISVGDENASSSLDMLYRNRYVIVFGSVLFGVVYYLMTPLLLSGSFYRAGYPFSEEIYSYSSLISWMAYLGGIAAYLLAFTLGFFAVRRKIYPASPEFNAGLTFKILLLLFAVAQFSSFYALRDVAFRGYSTGLEWHLNNEHKSFLSGLNIVYVALAVYAATIGKRWLFLTLAALLSINSIFLLGLGGRMYVVPAFLALFYAYLLSVAKLYNSKKMFALMLLVPVIAILVLIVGLARQDKAIALDGLVFVFMAEASFTWLSAGSFLTENVVPLFAVPVEFASGILALIPTVLWPSKYEFIAQYQSEFTYYNPVGATSIVYVMLANFGVVGAAFAFFLLGAFCKFLVNKSIASALWRTFFVVFFTLVPFMFFRSNAALSIKNAVFIVFLVPSVFIVVGSFTDRLIKFVCR